MRTLYYPSWKKLFSESKGADVWYPGEIRIYDEVEKANSTIVVLKSVDLETARGQHLHQGLAGVEEPMTWRAALAALALSLPALAQRPDENALFGGSADAGPRPPARARSRCSAALRTRGGAREAGGSTGRRAPPQESRGSTRRPPPTRSPPDA
jgi:hypothetical protein